MPHALVAAVVELRVDAVKLAHAQRQIAFNRFNTDVVVERH